MRAGGVSTVREWVNTLFPLAQRGDKIYLELFNGATSIDFRVASCKSTQEVMQLLGSDDSTEIILRRIAAFVHEKRTGDTDAANSMLAVKPAGSGVDVAPDWLVAEASIYSREEHRRRDRARAGGKGGGGGGRGGDKGAKGKDPKGKGGRGGKDQGGRVGRGAGQPAQAPVTG